MYSFGNGLFLYSYRSESGSNWLLVEGGLLLVLTAVNTCLALHTASHEEEEFIGILKHILSQLAGNCS